MARGGNWDSSDCMGSGKRFSTVRLLLHHLILMCTQVWTWVASDVVFKNDTASLLDTAAKEVRADKVKIVCVDARVAQS